MFKEVKAFAPATVANICVGFDILGLALENPGDIISIRVVKKTGVFIKKITGDNGELPLNPEENTVGVAILEYLKHLNLNIGIEIELHKGIPIGSGMGSSAASAVGGLCAINYLMGNKLKLMELLPFALKGEEIACGSRHADNVAPAIFGGLVLIRSYEPLDILNLPYPENLYVVLINLGIKIKTRDAREILPQKINLKDAVRQWGNIGGFISGLFNSDFELISRSMEDIIVEPIRGKLIPYFFEAKKLAIKCGAIGCGISGSGPSIFALCSKKKLALKIANTLKSFYNQKSIKNKVFISKINKKGAYILEVKR